MTVIGMWLAIVGYGLAYAGAVKVGGGQCGILQGFKGQCTVGTKTTGTQAQSGTTTLAAAQAAQAQQSSIIPNAPIPQGATAA